MSMLCLSWILCLFRSTRVKHLPNHAFPTPAAKSPSPHPPPTATTTTTTSPPQSSPFPTISSSTASPESPSPPSPPLPSLSLACRRFSLLLTNPSFHNLRQTTNRLLRTLFSISISDLGLLTAAAIPIPFSDPSFDPFSIPFSLSPGAFSQPRLAAIGRFIYIIGRGATLRYDTLIGTVVFRAPAIFPRKKFAAAVIGGRTYVCGGATRTSAVEEYDPEVDEWRVVAEAPRRRYGCVGAAVGGVFYVIGGLRVGCRGEEEGEGRGARTCAGTMDGYHVRAGMWLRVRAVVPGGGCVVGACGEGALEIYASNSCYKIGIRTYKKGSRGSN